MSGWKVEVDEQVADKDTGIVTWRERTPEGVQFIGVLTHRNNVIGAASRAERDKLLSEATK